MLRAVLEKVLHRSLVVQTLDGVIYRINHCPVDKFLVKLIALSTEYEV